MLNISGNRNKLLQMGGEPYQYNYGERNEIYASDSGQPVGTVLWLQNRWGLEV